MTTNSLDELRQEYLSNFYAHKIQQIENKEEVLEDKVAPQADHRSYRKFK